MVSNQAEQGIRRYLEGLGQARGPVVDREAVKALKAQIAGETDVINKVKLLSELEREEAGRVLDLSADEAVFVAEAKSWAEEAEVTPSALQALGVPDEVLQRAGFEFEPSRRRGGSGRRSTRASGGRAPAIPLDRVAAEARKLGSGWRITDLAEVLDREPMTVRNYVMKLIEQGVFADLGDDPRHDGRGRAPKIYGVN